jgi:hypothetical protein
MRASVAFTLAIYVMLAAPQCYAQETSARAVAIRDLQSIGDAKGTHGANTLIDPSRLDRPRYANQSVVIR